MDRMIAGKLESKWLEEYPLLKKVVQTEEVYWENPSWRPYQTVADALPIKQGEIDEAAALFQRFIPFFTEAFSEAELPGGKIISPLKGISEMKKELEAFYGMDFNGDLWLKCDNELPVAGSIKARGGFYEILQHAEKLAIDHGMIEKDGNYAAFHSEKFQSFFAKYSIAVGSTGNLGLSIGIISAKLGFRVTVHMSRDAKDWKKEKLRSYGVQVVEHPADFSVAVEKGREECAADPACYFVDDEDSKALFLGYSVAARELEKQLKENNIQVDEQHPLIVYLPCGVGGGPGGVTYGLKQIFGDHAHCIFAEPTHSPAMLVGMMTGMHDKVSVQDFGIDNLTAADGLAVGRPSGFAGPMVEHLLSAIYTIGDDELYKLLYLLNRSEGITLEPSALAGMYGPYQLTGNGQKLKETLRKSNGRATHVVWATGGRLVPEQEAKQFIAEGKRLMNE